MKRDLPLLAVMVVVMGLLPVPLFVAMWILLAR